MPKRSRKREAARRRQPKPPHDERPELTEEEFAELAIPQDILDRVKQPPDPDEDIPF